MKVKMLETFQEVGRETMLEGKTYDVDAPLGQWLLENRKAIVDQPIHYGAQDKPELRHDDALYEQMTKDTTGEKEYEELAKASAEEEGELPTEEEQPIMSTENQATTKRKRGKK